jgi:hypothetical protein
MDFGATAAWEMKRPAGRCHALAGARAKRISAMDGNRCSRWNGLRVVALATAFAVGACWSHFMAGKNGNGKPLTNDELRAAQLAIMDDPAPPPIDPLDERLVLSIPALAAKLSDPAVQCWGPCSAVSPCANCRFRRKLIRLFAHQATYGKAVHPSDAAGYDDKPATAAKIIHDYFVERYKPAFRRGATVHCADGAELTMHVACVPNSRIIELLATTVDAPRDKHGIEADKLPGFFRKWAPVAWGDLLAELQEEINAKLGDDAPARETFARLVRETMFSQHTFGRGKAHDDVVEQVERRSLIDWCVKFAKPGPWRDVRSLACWCKCRELAGGELELQVAIRHELFAQAGADRWLRQIGPTMFARLAGKYGIGVSSEKDRPQGRRAIVLDRDFVSDLTAGIPDDEYLPTATIGDGGQGGAAKNCEGPTA